MVAKFTTKPVIILINREKLVYGGRLQYASIIMQVFVPLGTHHNQDISLTPAHLDLGNAASMEFPGFDKLGSFRADFLGIQ